MSMSFQATSTSPSRPRAGLLSMTAVAVTVALGLVGCSSADPESGSPATTGASDAEVVDLYDTTRLHDLSVSFDQEAYDDMIARLKLKQAYGRLIRRATDRGVFVMLDSMLPSRLAGAFPETVPIQRMGLAEVSQEIKKFLD
jgi:hypothetical protein